MIKFAYVSNKKAVKTADRTFEEVMQIASSEAISLTCEQIAEAVRTGDMDRANELKGTLPCVVWNRSYGDGNRIKKNTGTPTGVVMMDWDTCETEDELNALIARIKELALTNDFVKEHLLAAHISPRRHGCHALWAWVDGCRSIEEVQERVVRETGLGGYDESCKDNSRKSFLVCKDMFFYINDRIYDTEEWAKRQMEQEAPLPAPQRGRAAIRRDLTTKLPDSLQAVSPLRGTEGGAVSYPDSYNGVKYSDIIKSLVKRICSKSQLTEAGEPSQGNRHLTWLKCCSHLRTITDNNAQWLCQLAPQWAYDSPGNDVMQTCVDACEEKLPYGISKTLQGVIDELSSTADVKNEQQDAKNLSWSESFREKHKMPELPPIIKEVVKGSPKGYEDAMLLHLMSMFGSLCFSKVRARYLDREVHAPNLQVIIEGGWGQGKGKFESVYKKLFYRTIEKDKVKLGLEAAWDEKAETTGANKDLGDKIHQIVQTAGIGITKSKLVDVLCDNMKIHLYMFESEIKAVTSALRTGYGLTYEHIRKAFENGDVYQNTKSRQSKTGIFPVFFNYTFTGTPVDVEKFIGKELEGGTASRICWSVIPGAGREPGILKMPSEEEIEKIRDKIEEWQSEYCYNTIEGEDVPVDDVEIDLGYVNEQLHGWILSQWDIAELEGNQARKDARTRMATIAFHCAMVAHLMYGCPSERDKKTRQKVCDLARYIATYCIERFLHKFSESQNEMTKANRKSEMKKKSNFVLDFVKPVFTREEFILAMAEAGKSTKYTNVTTTLSRYVKSGFIEKTKKDGVYKNLI